MRGIIRKIRDIIFSVIFYPIIESEKFISKKETIFCECYIHSTLLPFKKRNWGDDLNKFLFEYISPIKIMSLPFSQMNKTKKTKVYSLIGSVLSSFKITNKIVYGTGIMDPERKIIGKPKKIISVRGPKTRQVLVNNGIECPECYGDPVLLLPLFYESKTKTENRGGIILNMGTTEVNKLEVLEEIIKKYDLKVISMTNYADWTDVIDEICSCKYIISESLHGLIVAETYGIPNVWVEFIEHPKYWDFKFEDYYESIGKKERIIRINTVDNMNQVLGKIKEWEKGYIDYTQMLNQYPFKIKEKFK